MVRLALILGLMGLIAATVTIAASGWSQVLVALSLAGWGIVGVSLLHLIPLGLSAIGWWWIFPRHRPSIGRVFYYMWLRAGVNNLMPVARIGGEVVSVRMMTKDGIRKSVAIGTTVVELTLSVLAVFLFNIIGIGLFAFHIGNPSMTHDLLWTTLLAAPLLIALVAVQKWGFFGLLDKVFRLMLRDTWTKIAGDPRFLDRTVHTLYRRKKRIAIGFLWQFLSWISGAVEIMGTLFILGHPIGWMEAIMLEALIQAAASAAFAVPGALGVQEAGFMVFGRMLGLSPETAAALAIIRRCRDVLLFVPALLVWQIHEGRSFLRLRKPLSPPKPAQDQSDQHQDA